MIELDITFDESLAAGQVGEQELRLLQQYLPELLKEMVWQIAE